MNIPSPIASYNAWSLTPAGPKLAAEVDIRRCDPTVSRLQGRQVVVRGKLIDRGRDHLPLLVAETISAEGSQELPEMAATDPSATR